MLKLKLIRGSKKGPLEFTDAIGLTHLIRFALAKAKYIYTIYMISCNTFEINS